MILRILRGDSCLDGKPVPRNGFLSRDADHRIMQGVVFGNQNLASYQIDPGDFFRDRVLDLNAGIHLNEVGLVLVQIIEELDGSGVLIPDFLGEFDRILTHLVNELLGEPKAGGYFDDLLMSALNGTIAFVQMNDVAMSVCQNLNLNVLGLWDELLEENGRITESTIGFALGLIQKRLQLAGLLDNTHASPSTAKRSLDDEWKADFLGFGNGLLALGDGFVGSCQGRNANALGDGARRSLVTHHVQ